MANDLLVSSDEDVAEALRRNCERRAERLPHLAGWLAPSPPKRVAVAISPEAFSWLRKSHGPRAVIDGPGLEADRAAAEFGAAFALRSIAGREGVATARVVINRIRTAPVDPTPEDIAYASCRAFWQALGVQGALLPELPSKHAEPRAAPDPAA